MLTQQSTLRRAWDRYDAYLFDIDGTLVNCTDAVHYHSFCDTLEMLAGRPLTLDGVTTHGNTDIGILRDALALAGVPEIWRSRLNEARTRMSGFVEQRKHDVHTTVLPSVQAILEHLLARGAVLGVATGNLKEIGRIKLNRAGLLQYFSFGGYSDEYEYRCDVFKGALTQAKMIVGSEAVICVVGDTPEDILSARSNGLDVIAVATGIFTWEQLAAESPGLCLHSLNELL